jgi:hypothetical protein
MMSKDSSLRTNRYSPANGNNLLYVIAASTCGSFARTLLNFGSPQLQNSSLQRAGFFCPSTSICPRYCNPETLAAVNTAANPQFASVQQSFCKGNGSVRECAVQLERLITIRIYSSDPGQHILAKQRLISISDDQLPSADSAQWHWQNVLRC